MKFLKDKSWPKATEEPTTVEPTNVAVEAGTLVSGTEEVSSASSVTTAKAVPLPDINPDDVVAWLVNHAYGTFFLESLASRYMRTLRIAPEKLTTITLENRNVFSCHTVSELDAVWHVFQTAPNYDEVNQKAGHGEFSAGLATYRRYLEYLSQGRNKSDCSNSSEEQAQEATVVNEELVKPYRDFLNTLSVGDYGRMVKADNESVRTLKRRMTVASMALGHRVRYIKQDDNNLVVFEVCKPKELKAKTRPVSASAADLPEAHLDPAIIEQLTFVLSAHFSNGYRLNSLIEMARFRSFAGEDLGEEITLSDDELKSYVAACGTTFDGKVYAVSAQSQERIKELAEEYFSDGAQAIFFAEFYAKNEKWLFGASVVSEDMLIGILRKLFPKLSFTQTYFGYTDASVFAALESEILRVWGDEVLLTYEQLALRLQYIPIERIKYALGQNGDFIWSSVETFSHVSRIDINDEERQAIRDAAVRECNTRGYASITDLPFGEIEERNYELSVTAVHNAVYRICLSDKFDKKGKIVTRKGDVFDALTVMKEYCRTIDKCSLDDLLNFERELTGEVHRWIPMEAGNSILVRIDKVTYVADRYVHFDADVIDDAIGLCVEGDYLPLKSFTTFGAFPDCGQTWNLFLLESYCRRFSRKFRFGSPSVNSRNAGAVIRKSCGMDYTEIMTDALANADVPLKDALVGRFLYESGYTGRSTTAKVGEIIDKAKAIRERRG